MSWSHVFDVSWLQRTSIKESKRQHVTAGLASAATDPAELAAALERLSRELAALSYAGNSTYAVVTAQRTAVLRRLFECFEKRLKVLNAGAGVVNRGGKRHTLPPVQDAAVSAGVSVLLVLLEDALVRNPVLAAVLLQQLLQQVSSVPPLHLVASRQGRAGVSAADALCVAAFDKVASMLQRTIVAHPTADPGLRVQVRVCVVWQRWLLCTGLTAVGGRVLVGGRWWSYWCALPSRAGRCQTRSTRWTCCCTTCAAPP